MRRMSLFLPAAIAAAVATAAACGSFEGEDTPGVPDASTPDVTTPDVVPADDASQAADADAGNPCPREKTEELTPEADGLIAGPGPGSGINYGSYAICNMAVGRCLMRFVPSADALAAFANGKVTEVSLELRRADTHEACDPNDNCATPGFRQDGTLFVHPMLTTWNESQANWDQRANGGLWAEAGASGPGVDIGDLAGQVDAGGDALTVTASLDVRKVAPAALDGGKLGLRTEFLLGTTRRQFVAVMREPADGTNLLSPAIPPKLRITYCLPN